MKSFSEILCSNWLVGSAATVVRVYESVDGLLDHAGIDARRDIRWFKIEFMIYNDDVIVKIFFIYEKVFASGTNFGSCQDHAFFQRRRILM